MNCLTQEQLRKIEENKRAAIVKKSSQINSNTVTKPVHNPNPFALKAKKVESSPQISAVFQILENDRFTVNMKYHAASIDVFKTIAGRLYDANLKKWTFPIKEHDNLAKQLKKNSPELLLSLLPKIIISTCINSAGDNNEDIDFKKIDETLVNSLMPFQEEGVRFGIARKGRCMIADDMGLGKTIQALAIANYFKENWPLLIVCPSSMRFPWEEAIQTFLPSVNAFKVIVMTTSKDLVDDAEVVICSYDLMKTCLETLKRKMFGVMILDESHFLKSHKSARTKAALQLTQRCRRVVLLSGTPALSRPQELYPQIYAIDPQAFRTFHDFGIRYCDGKKTKFGWNFAGSSNMEELELFLKKRIMIRRLKCDVLTQLPSKLRKLVVLHPNMVKGISKQMNDFAKQLETQTGSEKRGTLLSYYCATGTAKLAAVCEYIGDKLECENKFLVFGHHATVLNGISELLTKRNVDFIRIDGATGSDSRKVLCDKFQSSDTCRVAVLSLKAANSGITLTAAQLVIFAELYWNPGELTQAEDRAHRIGQQDSVVVEYLMAKGTADEHLWNLVQSKLNVLSKAGLSKDSFKEADTEHQSDRNQPTLPSMFQVLEQQPLTDSEERRHLEMESSLFNSIAEDDDLFTNLNLDAIESEYNVESKKRKVAQ